MEDYKANSHRSKEELKKKEVGKIVTGEVKTKKKTEVRKFADTFISEDISNVKSYILMDILIPALKKAISDVVTNGIDMILYGETGKSKKSTTASKISYRSYYERDNDKDDYISSRRRGWGYDYDDVILESRGDAEEVLMRMDELIDVYGIVSVGDYYDLVGIQGDYTSENYGWTNIRNAQVVRVREGYMIKLPIALPIN